jgi:dihydroneopterin aldolase
VPARDVLSITGLECECVVGVYPRERGKPQPLRLDLDLSVDTDSAGRSGRLSRTVDYDATARTVVFLLQSCRFGLLETAAHALATFLLAPPAAGERRASIQSVRITLIKPEALPGSAIASLTVERDAAWAHVRREVTPWGSVDTMHESSEAHIRRINVAPRQEANLGAPNGTHESELYLTSGLVVGDDTATAGMRRTLEPGARRELANPTRRWQSLLAADSRWVAKSDERPLRVVSRGR